MLRHLLEVALAGLSGAALLERAGSTYALSQVSSGTVWIKEVRAGREGRPYWSRKDGGEFPDDVED